MEGMYPGYSFFCYLLIAPRTGMNMSEQAEKRLANGHYSESVARVIADQLLMSQMSQKELQAVTDALFPGYNHNNTSTKIVEILLEALPDKLTRKYVAPSYNIANLR